jgi:hypothetical protein
MMPGDSFDSRPDPTLGKLLRDHLDAGGDHAAFAARVRERLLDPGTFWEVLARWARPSVAAAVLAAALAGYWLVLRNPPERPQPVGELAAMDVPVDRDAVLGAVLGVGR